MRALSSNQSVRSQRGFSFTNFLIVLFVGVPFVITIMRTIPVYMEYFSVKKAMLRAVSECNECTKDDVRRLFQKQASIDDITSVKALDLEVTRAAGAGPKGISVSTDYTRKQELVEGSGISLLFEFQITQP